MKEEKEKLLQYFEDMKGLEESTRDYYKKISLDPSVDNQEVKDTFERISKDEQNHANLIEEVLNIIRYNL
jgi:rubrerythrin